MVKKATGEAAVEAAGPEYACDRCATKNLVVPMEEDRGQLRCSDLRCGHTRNYPRGA
jgi:hypothetical protein